MSSMISGLSNPLAWQQVLSQSSNLSYSVRGMYRVKDTDPGRKADYWFRDFGMVMACSYMTELSFRIVDKFYTIPHLTERLQLNKLSTLTNPVTKTKTLLYPNAQNYDRLPEIFQNRMMGTLVRGSSDLVPKIMREMADRDTNPADMHDVGKRQLSAHLKALLKNPLADEANQPLVDAVRQSSTDAEHVRNISHIDNQFGREKAVFDFLQQNPSVNKSAFTTAVALEDARQRGILIDHVQRKQNYKEYLSEKYFNDHPLKSLMPNFLQDYGDKVHVAIVKDKDELPKAIKAIWRLPPANRVKQFDTQFNEFKQHFFVREGQSFLHPDDLNDFATLGDKFRKILNQNKKADQTEWYKALGSLKKIQEGLSGKEGVGGKVGDFATTLATDQNIAEEFRSRLKKKLEETVNDIHKLIPGENPQAKIVELIHKLQLPDFFKDKAGEGPVKDLLQGLQENLPHKSTIPATFEQRAKIAKHIGTFIETLEDKVKNDVDTLLKPLLQSGKISHEERQLLVREALESKLTNELVSKIQKSSGWPKAFLTVAFNFVFYGFAASKFDNKILQPYQKKLVAERGTSQDIVDAGYWALIPGLAVLTQLFDKTTPLAAIRRMGSLNRFAMVGGAALSTFAGGTYLILQQLLKTPPNNPPKPEAPLAGSPSRRTLPLAFPAVNNAAPFALPRQPVSGFKQGEFAPFNGFQPNANGLPQALNAPHFDAQAPR